MSTTAITPRPGKLWYYPTLSPEHGVYVMLAVSFLTGAAAAQQWTWATTLALICTYCGFQAEHPLSLQIKQRRRWKPRFLLWLGIYGGGAIAIALWLLWHNSQPWALGGIYGAIGVAAIIDSLSIWQRQQKSVWNELIAFAAICGTAPLAYVATTDTLSTGAIALWLLNAGFFSSAIFTVKLRKVRTTSVWGGVAFHAISTGLVMWLWQVHWLVPLTAASFSIALVKFGLILWQKHWYCTTKIQYVAMIETGASVLFGGVVTLSLISPLLPPA
jgi:hypothetical protein